RARPRVECCDDAVGTKALAQHETIAVDHEVSAGPVDVETECVQFELLHAARCQYAGVGKPVGELGEQLLGVERVGRAGESGSPVDRRHGVILSGTVASVGTAPLRAIARSSTPR